MERERQNLFYMVKNFYLLFLQAVFREKPRVEISFRILMNELCAEAPCLSQIKNEK